MNLAKALAALGLALAGVLGWSTAGARAGGQPEGEAGKTVTVLAEGAGKTADDALKDAFRDAVRQVVGAVVDAETRVKNDEVISDKVLTASGGFVAGYQRLKLAEDRGLFRVKIKAQVERGELVERLRALKITTVAVKAADVLPAEKDRRFSDERVREMTKEEMVRNKTEILHDLLADLPRVLEARCRVPDRFDYDEKTGTLKLQVLVGFDDKRYAQFLKRLALRLDKLSLDRGFVTTTARRTDLGGHYHPVLNHVRGFLSEDARPLLGPDLSRADAWCLWVLSGAFDGGAGLRWTGYVLDADLRKGLAGMRGDLRIQVALRDKGGKSLLEDTLDLKGQVWLGNVTVRYKKVDRGGSDDVTSVLAPLPATAQVTEERTVNVLLAPVQFWPYWAANGGNQAYALSYVLTRPYPVTVRISREELGRLHDVRCTVLFRPER